MKNVFLSILLAVATSLCSCSKDEDTLSNQQQRIASYLGSTHSPKLVPWSETAEIDQTPYYTTSGNTVYRYISTAFNPNRETWPEITSRSIVTITFRAYVFTFSNIVTGGTSVTMPYYTNDPRLFEAFLELDGFNPEMWDFSPLRIDMREGGILKGLRHALLGCRQGDEVEAYMTYKMAYDDENFGIIPKESPIAIFFTVNSVE